MSQALQQELESVIQTRDVMATQLDEALLENEKLRNALQEIMDIILSWEKRDTYEH